jgi:hypothetical protein
MGKGLKWGTVWTVSIAINAPLFNFDLFPCSSALCSSCALHDNDEGRGEVGKGPLPSRIPPRPAKPPKA